MVYYCLLLLLTCNKNANFSFVNASEKGSGTPEFFLRKRIGSRHHPCKKIHSAQKIASNIFL